MIPKRITDKDTWDMEFHHKASPTALEEIMNSIFTTIRPRLQRYELLAPEVRPYGSYINVKMSASTVGEAVWLIK